MHKHLGSLTTTEALEGLRHLCEIDLPVGWRPHVLHTRAEQLKLKRDDDFRHPTVAQLAEALSGGPPANAADMRSIVLEVLERLAADIRHGDTSPWKRFWNVDQYERPIDARPKEQCRDALLDLLRERLKPYGMSMARPEVRRENSSRVDIQFDGENFGNLPLEAKCHWNNEIWSAPEEQLAAYAQSPGADGFGIYLVFWFGEADRRRVPGMQDRGGVQPGSAEQLKALIDTELPEYLEPLISILVLDVAKPSE